MAFNCQQFYFLNTKSDCVSFLLWSGQAKDRDFAEAINKVQLEKMEEEMKVGVVGKIFFSELCSREILSELRDLLIHANFILPSLGS